MTEADPTTTGSAVDREARALRAERLRLYQAHVRLAATGQWLGAGLLVVVLWGRVAPGLLLGWLAALTVLLGLRLSLWWRFRGPAEGPDPGRRLATIRTLSLISGATWGASALLLFAPQDLQAQTFLVFVLAGMAAGSLTLFAFDLGGALAFTLAALLPLGLRLLAGGDAASLGMGTMVLMFVAYLVVIGVRSQRAVIEVLRAREADAVRAEALLHSQRQLQALSDQLARKSAALEITLDSMDQGILSLGPDGRTQVFNRRVVELAELPADFLARGPTMAEIAEYQRSHGHYGDRLGHVVDAPAREALARWLAGERPQFPASYQRRMPSGRMLEVKSRYLPDGGLVRTFTDVTATVDAQAQTRKLALVASHTHDGVAIADADRRIEWVNAGFTRITGFTPGDVAGRRLRDILAGPAVEPAELARQDDDLARQGHTEGELQLLRRDGRPCWVQVEINAIAGDDGRVGQYVLMGRDVTARRQAEAALRDARDEAERASRAKSDFLSAMSHELRTPLNAILGFAQLLDSDRVQPLPERQQAQVRQILAAGAHLLGLINDVLDLARVEAGKQPVLVEPVPLQPLLDECLALVQPAADARGLTLVDDGTTAAGCVSADRLRLKQVLLNLLSNAVKYNRPGGEVRVEGAPVDGGWRLVVSDTGPGLQPAQRERLFTPFERLGAEGSGIEGAGIGLALSRQLMALMQGDIGVDSEPGQGSRFWLWLPAAAGGADSAAPGPATGPGPEAPAIGACTVLYIEDNLVNLLLVEAMLDREPGVRLLSAALPEVGLELARSQVPDLVLLDIQLPGMDGYEVLRRLREMPTLQRTPVVALSANAMEDDRLRARAAGFDAYLTKPVQMAELLAQVRRVARH